MTLNVLALDVETTTHDSGHPFSLRNRLCTVGIGPEVYEIEYSSKPYGKSLQSINAAIRVADLLVGFNIKFDLHWLARYGVGPRWNVKIWDVQQAHFILTGQKNSYPSMDEVLTYYGFELKLDKVKELWEKGYDTPDIPYDLLSEYQADDVRKTMMLYERQKQDCNEVMYNNIINACTDELITAEMERNGILYDVPLSLELGKGVEEEIYLIDQELQQCYTLPVPINWNSGQQLSTILYGGNFEYVEKEPYLFEYKDPRKEPIMKLRKVVKSIALPRLVEPLRGTELKAPGFYKTDEATLVSLRAKNPTAKAIIGLVLTRSKLEKKLGTYYYGIPKIIEEKGWEGNLIHTQLNHCVAQTGRLSSSKPNVQNVEGGVQECLITRYN